MPRIPIVPPEEATGELADAYSALDDLPIVPTVFQLASIRPDLTRLICDFYPTLFLRGELSRPAKDAIATYVSALNHCSFCTSAQGTFMQLHGASPEQIEAARAGDLSAFSNDDEVGTFLPLAEKITRNSHEVTDDDIESLRSVGWSDEKILEAIYVVIFFALLNRLADTLGIVAADAEDDVRRAVEALAQQT